MTEPPELKTVTLECMNCGVQWEGQLHGFTPMGEVVRVKTCTSCSDAFTTKLKKFNAPPPPETPPADLDLQPPMLFDHDEDDGWP